MKVSELFEAKAAFKLYTEHPYGHGLIQKPITKGEVLVSDDHDEAAFVGITADGKKVIVMVDGEKKEVSAKSVGGKIQAADAPVDGKDFMPKTKSFKH